MARFSTKKLQNKESHLDHEQITPQFFSSNNTNINYGYQEADITRMTKSKLIHRTHKRTQKKKKMQPQKQK